MNSNIIETEQKRQLVHKNVIDNFLEFRKSVIESQDIEVHFFGGRLIRTNNELLIYRRWEMTRTMNNVLFSSKALVEHTRNSIRNYKMHGYSELYALNSELVEKNFKYDPLSHFVESLRNYISHVGVIPTIIKEHPLYPYLYDKYRYTYNFDGIVLMKWKEIKGKSLDYVKINNNYPPVLETIQDYVHKIDSHQNRLLDFIEENYFNK